MMEKDESRFNWGIIAPGKIAQKFVDDFPHVNGAKLHAVASRSLDRAQAFVDKNGGFLAAGSYKELLDVPDIDCIYIASPHTLHYEQAIMCIEAGKNVLCEKPFAMDTGQVKKMVAKAGAHNVFLMEAMWTRFFPFVEKLDQLLEKQSIGTLKSISADFGFEAAYNTESRLFKKSLGGGALLDIGIYPVFIALYVFGYPDKISATAEFAETGADVLDNITFEYSDGRSAHLQASILEETQCECVISGEEGAITIHSRFHESRKLSLKTKQANESIDCGFEGKGYRWEIAHVQDCIQNGLKESPMMTHDLSIQLMQLLDEIRGLIGLSYDVD